MQTSTAPAEAHTYGLSVEAGGDPAAADGLIARALAAAHWEIDGPAKVVDEAIRADSGRKPDAAARRAKVGVLGLSLPSRLARWRLPTSIRALYPEALARLARVLAASGGYADEDYAKDVRFVVGASVPAGVQIIDLNDGSPLARRLVRRSALAMRLLAAGDLGHAARLAGTAQGRSWLQHHTDARYLDEFDEAGWRRFHLIAADLLAARPDAMGLFGASWFYDPQIVAVSPRLAYLQQTPMLHGALQVRLPTTAGQVAHAVHRSPTRQRLYETGEYHPACYALLWPRAELLAWAAREGAAG